MNAPVKIPLHNLDVEYGLIGCLMHDNSMVSSACAELDPGHFFEPVLGEIFDVIRQITAKGDKATPVTLSAWFQTHPGVKSLGGPLFFAQTYGRAAPAISAGNYARIIRDLYVRRQAITEAETAIADLEALPIDETASDYAAGMSQRLSEIAAEGITRKSRFAFSEVVNEAIDRAAQAYQWDGKRPDAISTGIPSLDKLMGGFVLGDLIIIAGRPSMGKTALGIEIARLSAARGEPADYMSLEMAAWGLGIRAISAAMHHPKVPYQRIQWGRFSEREFEEIVATAQSINSYPLTIIDQDRMTIAGIRAEVARSKAKRPDLKLVVIDYLGLILGTGNGRQNRSEEVGQITAELKRIAKQYQIALLVLVQLSRGVESRDNKRPQLSDLRESGSIEQDADVVIFPYREEYYLTREEPEPNTSKHIEWTDRVNKVTGLMEIIVSKYRQGRTGTVKVNADMATNSIRDIADNQPEIF